MVGKRVLVTGAGTGIGRGIGLEFAEAGATVAFHYSHSARGADSAVAEIRAKGGTAEAFSADFTRLEDVRKLAGEALAFLGGIDILVNNAGITMNKRFDQTTPEQFEVLYAVNVRAPFFLIQALLPALEQSKGAAVINLSSIHAFRGMQEHTVYAGTRGAIVAFTRTLAIELAPRGIRVNSIAPGATDVENQHRVIPNFDPVGSGKDIPAGFMGKPSDIGKLAVFLASDAARYIVGQTILVDGGTSSWLAFGDGFRKPLDSRFGEGYVPGI
jgi:NAD(P)-dependent dehydrogenase (short-subunit alcohol dehydrogenase family)